MTLVVILTVRPGALASFRAFETAAARVLARHGGAIERAVFVPPRDGELAREIHVVRIPDAAALAAYRADPELSALAELREASIADTTLLVGEDGPDYHAP